MGHSIQTFKNNHMIATDFDTSIILRSLIDIVQSEQESYDALIPLVRKWEFTLEAYATGCVDMALESIEDKPDAINQLRKVVNIVSEYIESFGSEVEKDLINEKYKLGGVGTSLNYSTKNILVAINKLKNLILS